jgi:hypothetical protein
VAAGNDVSDITGIRNTWLNTFEIVDLV